MAIKNSLQLEFCGYRSTQGFTGWDSFTFLCINDQCIEDHVMYNPWVEAGWCGMSSNLFYALLNWSYSHTLHKIPNYRQSSFNNVKNSNDRSFNENRTNVFLGLYLILVAENSPFCVVFLIFWFSGMYPIIKQKLTVHGTKSSYTDCGVLGSSYLKYYCYYYYYYYMISISNSTSVT